MNAAAGAGGLGGAGGYGGGGDHHGGNGNGGNGGAGQPPHSRIPNASLKEGRDEVNRLKQELKVTILI